MFLLLIIFRSHSPLSPKPRNMGTKTVTEEGEITPAKELERLVKEVCFCSNCLSYFNVQELTITARRWVKTRKSLKNDNSLFIQLIYLMMDAIVLFKLRLLYIGFYKNL